MCLSIDWRLFGSIENNGEYNLRHGSPMCDKYKRNKIRKHKKPSVNLYVFSFTKANLCVNQKSALVNFKDPLL